LCDIIRRKEFVLRFQIDLKKYRNFMVWLDRNSLGCLMK